MDQLAPISPLRGGGGEEVGRGGGGGEGGGGGGWIPFPVAADKICQT